jgi:hypothetical protein
MGSALDPVGQSGAPSDRRGAPFAAIWEVVQRPFRVAKSLFEDARRELG